jgi:hypothetical protein
MHPALEGGEAREGVLAEDHDLTVQDQAVTRCGRSMLGGTDRENQEVSMLALHLLLSALVFVNTSLVQSVLKDPAWADRLTDADRRALSPRSGRTPTSTAPSRSTWTSISTSAWLHKEG